MNIVKHALVLAALAAGAGQACAQAGAQPATETPLYVGLTFGQAHWRPGCFDTAARCDDTESALRGLAGWQFNKYLAAEVGYHNFSKVSAPGFFVKANAWEAVLVGSWPLFGSVSVYGKAGGYRGAAENNASPPQGTTNYNGTYGFGLAIDISKNITLRGEWQSYIQISGAQVSPRSDLDVMSVGALWRFR
jgi:hypothetical protein